MASDGVNSWAAAGDAETRMAATTPNRPNPIFRIRVRLPTIGLVERWGLFISGNLHGHVANGHGQH